MTLAKLLVSKGACSDARVWVGASTLQQAWGECPRGDWMLWLCSKMQGQAGWPDRKQIVLAACACAETALVYVKAGEERPARAIAIARQWATIGDVTLAEVRQAAAAAYAANAAAAAYAANAADDAAADDAYAAAAYAAYAADAAYAAYAAAAYAADAADAAYAAAQSARTSSQLQTANICRQLLTIPYGDDL